LTFISVDEQEDPPSTVWLISSRPLKTQIKQKVEEGKVGSHFWNWDIHELLPSDIRTTGL
jgi:hypothetical protein